MKKIYNFSLLNFSFEDLLFIWIKSFWHQICVQGPYPMRIDNLYLVWQKWLSGFVRSGSQSGWALRMYYWFQMCYISKKKGVGLIIIFIKLSSGMKPQNYIYFNTKVCIYKAWIFHSPKLLVTSSDYHPNGESCQSYIYQEL